jgi:hypothetical protein
MAINIENNVPVVQYNGLNSAKDGILSGSYTFSGTNTHSGSESFSGSTTFSGSVTIANASGIISIGDNGTATATAGGTATINAQRGSLTTAALTTAQGTATLFVLTNSKVTATSQMFFSVYNGATNTQGIPHVARYTPGTGTVGIMLANGGTSGGSLNGSVVINFLVLS